MFRKSVGGKKKRPSSLRGHGLLPRVMPLFFPGNGIRVLFYSEEVVNLCQEIFGFACDHPHEMRKPLPLRQWVEAVVLW